jgi:hypothetical protein
MNKKDDLMRVQVMKRTGEYVSTYSGIHAIKKSFAGDIFMLFEDLNDDAMLLLGKDPNEDENTIIHEFKTADFLLMVL